MDESQSPAWAGILFFLGFLVIFLLVPWVMAREPLARDSSLGVHPRPFFSSDRERRLWLVTLAVLALVYSTLGLTNKLALTLREANLLGLSSTGVLLVVGAVIALRWARTGPGRHEVAAAIGVMAVCLMVFARTTIPERSHLFEYGMVAILIYQALKERRRNGRTVLVPPVLAVMATVLLGFLDEGIQSLIPSRVYDPDDVIVNAVSACVAIVASVFLGWARGLDLRSLIR